MGPRVVAILSMFVVSSTVSATIRVRIVPLERAPYSPGQVVEVHVQLVQQDRRSNPHLLRLIQFDVGASTNDPFGMALVPTHPEIGIYGWDFSTAPLCATDPLDCGRGHFVDDEFMGPGILGPDLFAIAYYFVDINHLGPEPQAQLSLAPSVPLTVFRLQLTMPEESGLYTLDVLNWSSRNPNRGGIVYYGFGLERDDPIRIHRPNEVAPIDLIGGKHTFAVVNERRKTEPSQDRAGSNQPSRPMNSSRKGLDDFTRRHGHKLDNQPEMGILDVLEFLTGEYDDETAHEQWISGFESDARRHWRAPPYRSAR
jgi:hypothetical protein